MQRAHTPCRSSNSALSCASRPLVHGMAATTSAASQVCTFAVITAVAPVQHALVIDASSMSSLCLLLDHYTRGWAAFDVGDAGKLKQRSRAGLLRRHVKPSRVS